MDVFAEHAVAGMVGLIFNALFGASYIIGLDGVNVGLQGGWLDHNWKSLYIQIAYILAATGWSFVISAAIAWLINKVPGLHLRASEEAELLGMDEDQLGEFAYDYVEVRRDYLAWTPASDSKGEGSGDIPMGRRHGIPQHSQMIEGKDPEAQSGHESPANDGNTHSEHTGIKGDRHGVAFEKTERQND